MIEGALTSLMNGILSGAALTSAGKKTDKKEDKQLTEPRLKKKASGASDEGRKLTKEEKDELEYLLVAGGLSTKQAKEALSGEPVPRKWFMDFDKDTLKQIADITGAYDYSNFIYDGDKIGKGMTVIPLTKRNKPNTETMPLGEAKGKKTTIEGEEAKDKKTVMKGEEAKKKGTVMEIPEEDLSRLIEEIGFNDPDWDSPLIDQFAMNKRMHKKDVLKQLQDSWNREHQERLNNDLQKQAQKDGRIEHDNKIKDPKFKKATEEAAEKYKKETPDYKYDDVKRKNEANGKQYTTERHSGEPSKEEIDKADDFVMKNAGRDYEARLDRAKNYSSIWSRNQ
jgi:hypothetical protein